MICCQESCSSTDTFYIFNRNIQDSNLFTLNNRCKKNKGDALILSAKDFRIVNLLVKMDIIISQRN